MLVVLAAAVLLIAAPLRLRARPRPSTASESAQRADLEAAKEAKYREIRDAELDYRTGKLAREDWRAARRGAARGRARAAAPPRRARSGTTGLDDSRESDERLQRSPAMEHRDDSAEVDRTPTDRRLRGLARPRAAGLPARPRRASSPGATNSSPITLSADGKYLWSVNPGGDTVSVIYTRTNRVITRIKVGDEPESVAVDPNNRYAYVANAASGSVTVIRITRASARQVPRHGPTGAPAGRGAIVTGLGALEHRRLARTAGACSWRTAARTRSPSSTGPGRARKRGVIGHVNLKSSRCNDPDRTRHFQPRGLAVLEEQQAPARHELLLVDAAGRRSRPATPAGRASSAGSASAPARSGSAATALRSQGRDRPAGDRVHGRLDRRRRRRPDLGVPEPDAEHRDPRQPGLPAEHRRLAHRGRCGSTSTRRRS